MSCASHVTRGSYLARSRAPLKEGDQMDRFRDEGGEQARTRAETTRRELVRLGLAAPAALGLSLIPAVSLVRTAAAGRAASVGQQTMCILTPAQVEGPYWIGNAPTRSDITEGLPG